MPGSSMSKKWLNPQLLYCLLSGQPHRNRAQSTGLLLGVWFRDRQTDGIAQCLPVWQEKQEFESNRDPVSDFAV